MSTTTEDVVFEQGGDTGEDEALAVQPVGYAGVSEPASSLVLNRIVENLRKRTEVLREELRALKFRSNYDSLSLSMTGTVEFRSDASPTARLIMTGDLMVTPHLAPGYNSGGRALGAVLFIAGQNYAGTLGVNDLTISTSSDYTGQRAFADGETMADGAVLSVGSNNITVELAGENRAGGAGSIRATVTGTPRRLIQITYGTQAPGVTIAELVNAINNDSTLFGTEGTFGLRHMIRASTTSPGTSTSLPDFAETQLQGGYDSEAHQVTAAQMAAFFAVTANRLLDGEGLAIGFAPGLVEDGGTGGRRQALTDYPSDRLGGSAPNIGASATYGNLFNTARQPELIPNSLPIGRRIGSAFYFFDGTVVQMDGEVLSVGESYSTVTRILALEAATTAALNGFIVMLADPLTGAGLVGYNGSGPYNPDAGGSANPDLAAGTLEVTLDQLVADLASMLGGESGARRIGIETLTGVPSTGNVNAPSISAGSIREAVQALLGDGSNTGGLAYRVHEDGHAMKGAMPLKKEFAAAGMPASGSEFLRAELHSSANLLATPSLGLPELGFSLLKPIQWTGVGDDALNADEPATANAIAGSTWIAMTAPNLARFDAIKLRLPVPRSRDGASQLSPVVLVKLTGTTGAADADDGFYFVINFDSPTRGLQLRKLDMTLPDFTGMVGPAQLNFYVGLMLGNDLNNVMVRGHLWNDDRPAAVMGLGAKDQPVLELVYNDGSDPNVPSAQFFGNSAQWASLRRIAGGAAVRNTENILVAGDKQLNDGVETGTPVDATLSHHHGGTYTATVFRSAAHSYTPIGDMSTGPWFFATPADAPAGYVKTALIINFSCQLVPNIGVVGTDVMGLVLEFAGSTDFATFFAATEGMTMTYAAVGAATMFLQGQVTVPLYFDPLQNFPTGADGFKVRIQGGSTGSGVDLTVSSLAIDEVGYVLARQ